MQGKIVKVSSYQLIQYFYPRYKVREELSFLDKDNYVLYIGKSRPRLKEYLRDNTKGFISVSGNPEVDFTDMEVLVKWVYSLKGKEPSKKVIDSLSTMEADYVEYLCKVYWLTGRWIANLEATDKSIYDLFMSSISSVKDILTTYFELRKIYPYEVLESSFITFLYRVVNIEDQNVSVGYLKLLRQARQKFGTKVKPLVLQLGLSDGSELSFINMLLELR